MDTSKLSTDQRLPPYPYSTPGLLLPSQPATPKPLQQPGLTSQACSRQPSGGQPLGRPLHFGSLYPPSSGGQGQPSYHRPGSDFGLGSVSTRVQKQGEGWGGVGSRGPCVASLVHAELADPGWWGRGSDPWSAELRQPEASAFLRLTPALAAAPQPALRSALADDSHSDAFSPGHAHALSRQVRRPHQLRAWCLPLGLCLPPSSRLCADSAVGGGACFAGQTGRICQAGRVSGTPRSEVPPRALSVCPCVRSWSSSPCRARQPAWRWTPLAFLKDLDF